MKYLCTCFSLVIMASLLALQPALLSARSSMATHHLEMAYGMKNITVFAKNAASALAEAQAKNPDWVVISVTKVNKDPKSMAYRVVLKKK